MRDNNEPIGQVQRLIEEAVRIQAKARLVLTAKCIRTPHNPMQH
jgi:hypothetical protein